MTKQEKYDLIFALASECCEKMKEAIDNGDKEKENYYFGQFIAYGKVSNIINDNDEVIQSYIKSLSE